MGVFKCSMREPWVWGFKGAKLRVLDLGSGVWELGAGHKGLGWGLWFWAELASGQV